jgi:hypothetical protein
MMNKSFNELPWHDAILLELRIDRRRAGHADDVVLTMLWPDGRRSRIRFVGCYGLDAKMNFGIVAAETVRSAVEQQDSEELRALRAKWKALGGDLSKLSSFSLEMNSTGSLVTVYSESWIEELEN